MQNRPLHLIEVTHRGDAFDPHWLVLHEGGTRGVTPMRRMATQMTFPEAWCVLTEIARSPAAEFDYRIVKA